MGIRFERMGLIPTLSWKNAAGMLPRSRERDVDCVGKPHSHHRMDACPKRKRKSYAQQTRRRPKKTNLKSSVAHQSFDMAWFAGYWVPVLMKCIFKQRRSNSSASR